MSLEEAIRQGWKIQDHGYAVTHHRKMKARALKLNVPFDLTIACLADLFGEAECTNCPVLGIEMKRSSGQGGKANTPSVDRIFPDNGYTMGNIMIICQRANRIKHDATLDELRALVAYIESHLPDSHR